MGLLQSFNIGVSGLNAVGGGMGVIGDNIANAGTYGFKASRPEFQDVEGIQVHCQSLFATERARLTFPKMMLKHKNHKHWH